MTAILVQLAPIFFYLLIGILLKQCKVAEKDHGDFLLRFVFMVTLPLLILTTLPDIGLTVEKAMLPFANIAINLLCMGFTLLVARRQQLDRQTTGTMLVNTMIVNNSYMFPFILAVYGEEGFSDAILFDFGNALMMATYVYAVAFRYGTENHKRWTMLVRILKSPLVWSLLLAVLLALTGWRLPATAVSVIAPLGQMTGPLILVALGTYFSLRIANLRLVSITVAIRMGFGLLAGTLLAGLLGFEGTTFIVVSLCAGAPIGFTALGITSMAKLDTALSSSAVSLSILLGLVYVPVLILLFGTP